MVFRGQTCLGCGCKSSSTAFCALKSKDGAEVECFLLCNACVKDQGCRRLDTRVGHYKNLRWSRREEEESDDTLSFLATRALVLGILNRSPFLNSEQLGKAFDAKTKQLVCKVLLRYSNVSSDKFAEKLLNLEWAGRQDSDGKRSLGVFDLASCNIGRDELRLVEFFCKNIHVKELNVPNNRLGKKGAQAFADVISHGTCGAVNVSWNQIGDAGVLTLSKVLPRCSILRSLNLSANKIGPQGATFLAAALRGNGTLQELNMAFNEILAHGAEQLLGVLSNHPVITVINLRSNQIGPEGAFAAAHVFKVSKSIERIIVVDNNICTEGAEEMAKFFRGKISTLIECIGGTMR